MKTENASALGELSDRCDNLFHAAQIPMPAEFHKEQLSHAMAEIRDELRRIYVSETGFNPWE